MGDFAATFVERITAAFERERDDKAAAAMSAYMRNLFPFAGLASPRRKILQREALDGLGQPDENDLRRAARTLWERPEREYQYAAAGLLSRHVAACSSSFIADLRDFVTNKSWWDTVDELASHVAGPLVAADPALAMEMDAWASDDNLWVARTAILHQLRYKGRTDVDRLFRYCVQQAGQHDFFIRKAIGWALREYSKTDADAVRSFVEAHRAQLSPLSQREALLWLNGGRKGAKAASEL